MKVTQMPPVHAANLAANIGNKVYGVDVAGNGYVVGGVCILHHSSTLGWRR